MQRDMMERMYVQMFYSGSMGSAGVWLTVTILVALFLLIRAQVTRQVVPHCVNCVA
ncbi:MAG: hypothetical protein KDA63_12460 [Planctomycetales bacterium]|nr:hypothetical protein [Planctomycetales bacterium]